MAALLTQTLGETLGTCSVVRDRVQIGGAMPALDGTVGDDGAPFLCTASRAPAHDTVRRGASMLRRRADPQRFSRRSRQTNEGTDFQRHTQTRRSLGTQTGPLLEGPKRPRIEKPVVAVLLSDFLPFFVFQKATTELTLPSINGYTLTRQST